MTRQKFAINVTVKIDDEVVLKWRGRPSNPALTHAIIKAARAREEVTPMKHKQHRRKRR